jgi:multiple sugar transport system substrate-binding protein
VWQGKQYEGLVCSFLEILRGHGGFWIEPADLVVGLDRPEAVRALEFLVRCRSVDPISPPGVTTYQEEESRRLFQDGRSVFLRNWPYAWRLAQAEGSPLRGCVGARTMVCTSEGRPSGTLGGWGFGISSYGRRPELALEFVRFATSLESQRILCAPTGYAPVRVEAYEDSVLLAQNPFLVEIMAAHADAVIRPAIPRYALASDILQRHVSAALSGGETPARALTLAARETRAVLGGSAQAVHAKGGKEGP